ncbi:MAG: DUF305 domain-containing protein [Actinomycetota bacterium]
MLTVIGVLALLTAAVVGYAATGPVAPADDGADAGFARDMQTHHAQAVQMAFVIRDKTNDPTIRAIAYDIITSQQQQIGQMYAWLRQWGLPQAADRPPMAWMTESAEGSGMGGAGMTSGAGPMGTAPDGQMPGMATAADLQRLAQAQGRDAEIQFLRLMISHHRGGVTMAEAAAARAQREEVRALARTIATAQRAEIVQMQQLLRDRGVAVP